MVDPSIVMERVEARDSAVSTLSAALGGLVERSNDWEGLKGAAGLTCASGPGQKGTLFLPIEEYSKDKQNMSQLHQNLI